jgi:metabolite-proton symporter
MEPKVTTNRVPGADAERPVAPATVRRVAIASLIGTTIEWYDFFVYGTAAALVFRPQFFPNVSPTVGTIASLSTFAIGFVARPVGGALMGHVGDRIGRKSMLVASLIIMGLATVCIGLLPNFATIGITAPILLVLLRFVQGIGVGGEWGGAVLMSVEHAPRFKRTLYGSFPQMGLPAGVALASLAFLALRLLVDDAQFTSWGWRIPFLVSALLIAFGLVVRLKLTESPAFEAVQARKEQSRLPVVDVLRSRPRNLFAASVLNIAASGLGNILLVYTLTYVTKNLGVSSKTMLWVTVIVAVMWTVLIPVSAALADRYGRQRVFLSGAALCVVWAFPYFWLLNTGSFGAILLAAAVAGAAVAIMSAPHAALVAYAFPARIRYSGSSIAYALGGIAGGALAPIIATALFAAFGSAVPISLYLIVIGLISALGAVFIVSNMSADDAEIAQAAAAVPNAGRA